MIHGFLKACTVSPALRVADCAFNTQQTIAAMQRAALDGAQLAVFPELGLTGYTCGDLFFQQPLQRAAAKGLAAVLEASAGLDLVALVGLPVAVDGKLYNCAAVVCHGKLLGLVPKTHLPNYGEFYEKRQFNPAPAGVRTLRFAGQEVPFGTQLLFRCAEMPEFCLAAEVCEDLWAPLPPSTHHALAGATVIANLSASDETIGKADYRRALVCQQSARLLCTYLYADAGHGESTTDMVFAAHDLICENGALLAEAKPFGPGCACTELDLGRMVSERCRSTTFQPESAGYETVVFHLPLREVPLTRPVSPTPFVPAGDAARAERCELILAMQADGLAKRIAHAHAKTAVIGISGGLDSSLALLVAVHAMQRLGRPAQDVLAVTMPCFGTTHRTRSNAEILCEELGVTFQEIPIARHIVRYAADAAENEALRAVLLDILDTPVSPELLPANENGEIAQQTESLVGPYELHDFYLYYVLRFGFGPAKIYRLARHALGDRYPDDVLLHWLKNFYRRFFAQQFKRSCLPDGPKIGSVTLSPRGDWRMPSDACAAVWQAELDQLG